MFHPLARLFLLSGLRDNVWLFIGFLAFLFVIAVLRRGGFNIRAGNRRPPGSTRTTDDKPYKPVRPQDYQADRPGGALQGQEPREANPEAVEKGSETVGRGPLA